MKAAGFGRIINVASAHSLVASPFKSAYVAAKHGVLGLTRALATEMIAYNVTVNAICPGYVDTPMTDTSVSTISSLTGMGEEFGPKVRALRSILWRAFGMTNFTRFRLRVLDRFGRPATT